MPALAAMEEEEVLWMEMTVSLADCFVWWWSMHLLDASCVCYCVSNTVTLRVAILYCLLQPQKNQLEDIKQDGRWCAWVSRDK